MPGTVILFAIALGVNAFEQSALKVSMPNETYL
jgi:hypothetical protein